MNLRIAHWINYNLGEDWGGSPSPPGSNQTLHFGSPDDDGKPMLVASTHNNDGFELYLGYRSQYKMICRAEEARRLAWFILWTWWARGTWFGLRRRIWYAALHAIVKDQHRRYYRPGPEGATNGTD